MRPKLFTIAIATYNMEKYLARCIDSLLVPEIMNDIEILIINDGSTDASAEIAHAYQDKYPQTVRVIDKENGGYGSAINMAIDQARGKYFKTLDADDWFDSEELVKFIDVLKTTDADLIITHYSREQERTNESAPIYYDGVDFDKIYDFTEFCIFDHTGKRGFAMHAITYRTEILRMDNFRMSHCYYSDVDYSVYPLTNVKTVAFADLVLYKYLVGRDEQSVSAVGLVRHFDDHKYISKKLLDHYSTLHAGSDTPISRNIGNNAIEVMNNFIGVMYGALYSANKKRAKREIKEFRQYIKTLDRNIELHANERIQQLTGSNLNAHKDTFISGLYKLFGFKQKGTIKHTSDKTDIFYVLLDLFKVKHTKQFSSKLYEEHAHKDNLFGLSTMLFDYGIISEGLKIEDKDDVTALETPFVAQLNGVLVIILKITEIEVVYYYNNNEVTIPLSTFKEKWSGVVLVIYPEETAREPEYKENRKKENYSSALGSILAVAVLAVLVLLYLNDGLYNNAGITVALGVNLIGVYIGYLLILKQVKRHSASADKICSIFKQGDCNNVLDSKAAKLWGIIGWSEAGFGYFTSNVLALLLFPGLIAYVALINICALPYSVWSIWYQKVKAKQWCVLCIIVQVLFYLFFIVNLIFGNIHIPSFGLVDIITIGAIYIIPFCVVSLLVPVLANSLRTRNITQKLNSLKMDDIVFEGLLTNSKHYEVDDTVSQIVFGNPDAELQVTVISNPHCEPCGKAHEKLDKLMDAMGDRMCMRFIFINFNSEIFKNSGRFLIAAYLNNDEQTAKEIFLKWFTGEKYKVGATYEQYGFNMEVAEVVAEQQRHENWSTENKIAFTPTILINGYQMPDVYDINDLKLL